MRTSFAMVFLMASSAFAVELHLVNSKTGKPVAAAAVRIWSDNGIRCTRAPCPTNGKEWKGKSNAQGVVELPEAFVQQATNVSVEGYDSKNLPPEAAKQKRIDVKLKPGNH